MPQMEIRKKNKINKSSCYLANFAQNITAQNGEDGVIGKIFEIMPPLNKFCVEFGAWNGFHLSNTCSLIQIKKWDALLIEGDESKFGELKANYINSSQVKTLNRYIDFDENSLDNILSEHSAPRKLDLISIDVDGNDWHIWNSLENFYPRLVIIEFNPTIPNDVYFVQDQNPLVNHGCSLLALIELGKQKGYELVSALDHNALFVPKEEFPAFKISDNDIDSMYDFSSCQMKLFQGYDGTIFNAGCSQLIWKNVAITFDDIQVLPQSKRHYTEPNR